jgi:PAS domain S-box-containing protein
LDTLGYKKEELGHINLFDIIHPDNISHCKHIFERVMQGENFVEMEAKFITKSGKPIIVSGNANCRFENGIPIATRSIFRNITESKQAAEDLRKAKEEAEAANRAKSQFLANMSHELRTPLNSVIGFTNILRKNKDGLFSGQDLVYLERIFINGKHLLELINDVLDLSKIEAGRTELEVEQFDFVDLLNDVLYQFESLVREKKISLEPQMTSSTIPLESDPGKLKQVLINLIGNAVKFTNEGTVTVRVVTDEKNQLHRIDVVDTGIGIPQDRLDAIFHAFQQADTSTSRKYGGTGLGLAISKSMCELMDYRLTVDSTVEKGSTFSIHIRGKRSPSVV